MECWAWTRVRSILEGKASRVAAAMRRAATVAGFSRDTRKPVDTCADYLLKYAPYLHYDRYLAAGYPIATGVIEGACRYLVRDRMELTGARWRLVGAEAVLKLRALRASRDFDAYWDFHEAREYQPNHAQRYAEGTAPPVSEPPRRPPHHAFDGSSSSCRAARRSPWATDEEEPHSSRHAGAAASAVVVGVGGGRVHHVPALPSRVGLTNRRQPGVAAHALCGVPRAGRRDPARRHHAASRSRFPDPAADTGRRHVPRLDISLMTAWLSYCSSISSASPFFVLVRLSLPPTVHSPPA